jgi:hypothetical protein
MLLALGAALLLAPAAHASTPGINLSGPANVADAVNSGASYARFFVRWPEFQPDSSAQFKADVAAQYDVAVNQLVAHGIKPIFVVMGAPAWANGSSDQAVPPSSPSTYAGFMTLLAAHFAGRVAAYEVWNEEDETIFWHPAPDAARYAALLKATYPAVKGADPTATVLVGGLTGNDYDFLEAIYANGGQGAFDAVAVHTDTACLDRGPMSFYRDPNGRIARFTFLGYRSVHDVMAAHGDGAKGIWMTELGWSSTTTTCERGTFAGQKPAGVSEADQATYLAQAYHCMAFDPYVQVGAWFTGRDEPTQPIEEHRHYGLLRGDGSTKPAWSAFTTVTSRGDTLSGPCGDFDAPVITVRAPIQGQRFLGSLLIKATATDGGGSGLGRITFLADGKVIRNFTAGLSDGGLVGIDWQGAKKLSLGAHKITVQALDLNGNTATRTIDVKRVKALKATLTTRLTTKKVSCTGRTCRLQGSLAGPEWVSLDGKVKVQWQWKAGRGKFTTIHSGLKSANKPFTFKQRLKRAGSWRVRVQYLGKAPLKKSASRYATFRVR